MREDYQGTTRMGQSRPGRRLPVGAEVLREGEVHFRVWAPGRRSVEVVLDGLPGSPTGKSVAVVPLVREEAGYFTGRVEVAAGMLYRYRLDKGRDLYPDPA